MVSIGCILALSLFGGTALATTTSCGSSSVPESVCDSCGTAWVTVCINSTGGFLGELCGNATLSDCQAQWSGTWVTKEVPCDSASDDGGSSSTGDPCSGWDPAAEITLNGGVYEVDEAFFDSVVDDPTPLAICDDARLEPYSVGSTVGYKVVQSSSGEMLYELGLGNGIILREINGYPLEDFDDVAEAFGALIIGGSTTTFTLKYNACGNCKTTTKVYVLI